MLEQLTGAAAALALLAALPVTLGACGGSDGTGTGGHGGGGSGSGGAGGATTDSSTVTASTGGGGGGGACSSPELVDMKATERSLCTFKAGAKVADTLGLDAAARAKIPITHVVVIAQENRSFDHYFGKLAAGGQPDAEGWPATFTNPDAKSVAVAPHHLTSTCLAGDPPHQWTAMHAGWDMGAMDGFVKSASSAKQDGHYVLGYYDGTDLPFYYWLAGTFTIADRYFGSTLGGTWANRDYLYAATSKGVENTGQATLTEPTIFDSLDQAGVAWGVYTDGFPRQDCLGWALDHKGLGTFPDFLAALASGSLPPVTFLDPGPLQDEHPPNDAQQGEAWAREIYTSAIKSPLWEKLAIIYTYDESGGLGDHVPPPSACLASPDQAEFDHLGVRIPAMVISPWARLHHVSHVVHDHTSTLRLIEAIHDLPALTGRDANADALLDMFDFDCPPRTNLPDPPDAGAKGCP